MDTSELCNVIDFLSFNDHLLVFKIGIVFQYFLFFYIFSLNSNVLVLREYLF